MEQRFASAIGGEEERAEERSRGEDQVLPRERREIAGTTATRG
jgi:hypothetical protein